MRNKKLSGDYIAGFVDGEGCFALSKRRDVRYERKGSPVYYSWKAMFAIVLRSDDRQLLDRIRNSLNCGSITLTIDGVTVRYQVSNLDDLAEKIVPFFKKNRLRGKKGEDFEIWSDAIKILYKYKNLRKSFIKNDWAGGDILRMEEIKSQMKIYKSMGGKNKWLTASLGRGPDLRH